MFCTEEKQNGLTFSCQLGSEEQRYDLLIATTITGQIEQGVWLRGDVFHLCMNPFWYPPSTAGAKAGAESEQINAWFTLIVLVQTG